MNETNNDHPQGLEETQSMNPVTEQPKTLPEQTYDGTVAPDTMVINSKGEIEDTLIVTPEGLQKKAAEGNFDPKDANRVAKINSQQK